jgi:hypothetical protein
VVDFCTVNYSLQDLGENQTVKNVLLRGTLIVRETAYIICPVGNFTKELELKGVKATVVLRRKTKQIKLGLDARSVRTSEYNN